MNTFHLRQLVFLCALLCFTTAKSQQADLEKRFRYTHYSHTYRNSIGLVLGNYVGLSCKQYLSRKMVASTFGHSIKTHYRYTTAVQVNVLFNVGEPVLKSYYDKAFRQYLVESMTYPNPNYELFTMIDRRVNEGGIVQADYLVGFDLGYKSVQLYMGVGGQYRQTTNYYWIDDTDGTFERNYKHRNVGATATIGAEYQVPWRPLSFHFEFKPFFEWHRDGFYFWPQLQGGIRYNFIRKPDLKHCTNCEEKWQKKDPYRITNIHHNYNKGITLNMGTYFGLGYKHYFARKYDSLSGGFTTKTKYRYTTAIQANILYNPGIPPLMQKRYFRQAQQRLDPWLIDDPWLAEKSTGKMQRSMIIQLEYLVGKDFSFNGPQVYVGAGAQMRIDRISFAYMGTHEQRSYGVNPIAGIEYQIPYKPISLLAEFKPFFDVFEGDVYYWPQLNLGVRYNFIQKPDSHTDQ